MTIAVGFMTRNAVILCADSQEVVSDYTKTTTQNIRTTTFFNNWRIAVVGSGEDTTYIDAYYKDLQMKLGEVQDFDYVCIGCRATRAERQGEKPDDLPAMPARDS
jgi:hypothetical protein